jgi:hypothetical protein
MKGTAWRPAPTTCCPPVPGPSPVAGATLLRQGHFGLVAMQERVEMVGGRFQLDSRPGAGVVLRARFRVPPSA